jgi:ubiquinone/menaquinone biosynthesis C-methylase UbiE
MSLTSIFPESCAAVCKPVGLARQFRQPTGWLGWCIGQLMAVKNRSRSEWVIPLLDIRSTDQVLEVGFGSGTDIGRVSALASQGFVAGIDHSVVMVQQAKRRNKAAIQAKLVDLQQASAASIPFLDTSFNKVFAINVAQCWENPLIELTELHRVLQPSGSLALAIQPRTPHATEATAQATGEFLVNWLTVAGFEQVKLETKFIQPISTVCAIGRKKT